MKKEKPPTNRRSDISFTMKAGKGVVHRKKEPPLSPKYVDPELMKKLRKKKSAPRKPARVLDMYEVAPPWKADQVYTIKPKR